MQILHQGVKKLKVKFLIILLFHKIMFGEKGHLTLVEIKIYTDGNY